MDERTRNNRPSCGSNHADFLTPASSSTAIAVNQPIQPSLGAFKDQKLEESAFVMKRNSPLFIMVLTEERIRVCPSATFHRSRNPYQLRSSIHIPSGSFTYTSVTPFAAESETATSTPLEISLSNAALTFPTPKARWSISSPRLYLE